MCQEITHKKLFKFYANNDPKHKAYSSRVWLLYNISEVWQTSSHLTDLIRK